MRYLLLTAILVLIFIIVSLITITSLQRQLDDCQFECNHLQTKLWQLQELNDYVYAMEQIFPPLVLAQLKATTLMIRNERHKAYEGVEQSLLTEKEIDG